MTSEPMTDEPMTDEHWSQGLTLVTGGTGKTGRRVVDRLVHANRRVRIGSRSAEQPFDWERRETWAPVLDGVTAAYIAYQPDLSVPWALETLDAFFAQAIEGGVKKLVLLSVRGEVGAQQVEQCLQATGVDWTILRSSWFYQNFSESFLLDSILAGQVALPVESVPEPFIDVDDIADVAFAALSDPVHSHQIYEITGSKAFTFAEAIGEIAQATGREIQFSSISAEDYLLKLVRYGVPNDDIKLLLYLFATVLDGRNAAPSDGVERAIGQLPRDFSDYVRKTSATGVWNV